MNILPGPGLGDRHFFTVIPSPPLPSFTPRSHSSVLRSDPEQTLLRRRYPVRPCHPFGTATSGVRVLQGQRFPLSVCCDSTPPLLSSLATPHTPYVNRSSPPSRPAESTPFTTKTPGTDPTADVSHRVSPPRQGPRPLEWPLFYREQSLQCLRQGVDPVRPSGLGPREGQNFTCNMLFLTFSYSYPSLPRFEMPSCLDRSVSTTCGLRGRKVVFVVTGYRISPPIFG